MPYSTPRKADRSLVARLETGEKTSRRIFDLLGEQLGEEAAVTLSDAGGGRWQVAVHFGAAGDEDAVRSVVAAAAGHQAAAALRFESVAAKDWVGQSLAALKPVAAGRFIVHGAHDRARVPLNRIDIEIEAALAFGTGHHGTTRGCLLALDRICKAMNRQGRGRNLRRMLDLGTGSGVLAIAAARALRRPVLGTDIEATAVRVARGNARLNRVGALVAIVKADGVTAPSVRQCAPFDLVFANILLGPLQRLAAPLKKLTAPGSRIVLSGLLPSQANAVIVAYRPLALDRRIDLDGWTTLVFMRRTPPRRAVAHRLTS